LTGGMCRAWNRLCDAKIGAEAEEGFIVGGRGAVNRVMGLGGGNQKHPQEEEQKQDHDPKNCPCAHS
jgi:hypothetical protein